MVGQGRSRFGCRDVVVFGFGGVLKNSKGFKRLSGENGKVLIQRKTLLNRDGKTLLVG